MINEKQVYNAKVFLRSYRDALVCIQQSVIKKSTYDQYQHSMIEAENKDKEYSRLFRFSKGFLNKHFNPEPSTAEEFAEVISKIKQMPDFKSD